MRKYLTNERALNTARDDENKHCPNVRPAQDLPSTDNLVHRAATFCHRNDYPRAVTAVHSAISFGTRDDLGNSLQTPAHGPMTEPPQRGKPRRPHHKSRTGCVQCKQRKIKVCANFYVLQLSMAVLRRSTYAWAGTTSSSVPKHHFT